MASTSAESPTLNEKTETTIHEPTTHSPTASIRSSATNVKNVSKRRRMMKRKAMNSSASLPGTQPPPPRRAETLPNPRELTSRPAFNRAALSGLLQPNHQLTEPPTWKASFLNTVRYSKMNLLLIFIPVSWAVHFAGVSDTIVFIFSFISIIPLAALLGFATEELSFHVGATLAGILNATFGNAVELIIAILALVKGELEIVQSSMLGSILSNCLLVLGMCFFAGGIRFHEQGYGVRAQQLNISLLSISVFSIVIPAAFHASLSESGNRSESEQLSQKHILSISRGTSIILLIVYAAYLVFQLWTHAYLYTAQASAHHAAQAHDHGMGNDGPSAPRGPVFPVPSFPSLPSVPSVLRRHSSSSSTSSDSTTPSQIERGQAERQRVKETLGLESEKHDQKLKLSATIALLVFVTVITGVTAEWMVGSIDGLTDTGAISKEFVALILLPLVGNAAEHVTAVTVSVRNRLDLAMTVAVGSSIQIALFVIPFLVLLGWIIGQPLSLYFDTFETIVVFVSVLIVNYAISDGRTNWLEGLVLMVVYVIIGVSVWYYPGTGETA